MTKITIRLIKNKVPLCVGQRPPDYSTPLCCCVSTQPCLHVLPQAALVGCWAAARSNLRQKASIYCFIFSVRLCCSLGNHHSLNRFGAKRLVTGSADHNFNDRRWCVFAAPVELTGAVQNELKDCLSNWNSTEEMPKDCSIPHVLLSWGWGWGSGGAGGGFAAACSILAHMKSKCIEQMFPPLKMYLIKYWNV